MTLKSCLLTLAGLGVCMAVAIVCSWIIASLDIGMTFDKNGLSSGLIAFNTSATLAIFLTLFHSEDRRITFLRQHRQASSIIYMGVIFNTAIVSVSPLFLSITQKIFNIGIDNLISTFTLVLTIQVMLYLLMLISLYTKA